MRVRLMGMAAVVLASGCGLTEFDVSAKGSTTIQGSTLLGSLLQAFPPAQGFTSFDVSQTQDFQNQHTEKKYVKSAKLKALTLKITAPSDQDFNFLDSIQFFAEANGTKTRVAHAENISAMGLKAPNPTLALTLDPVDLTPVVKADTMSITTEAQGRQPAKDTTVEIDLTLHLGVGP
jgi:hypothetical protein